MFTKGSFPVTRALIKGKEKIEVNQCFNLTDNRILMVTSLEEHHLTIFSVSDLKTPLVTKKFHQIRFLEESPNGSILLLEKKLDHWVLALLSKNLEPIAESSPISYDTWSHFCFIDESTFFCSNMNHDPQESSILTLYKKHLNELSVSQNINLSRDKGQMIHQMIKIGKNQFAFLLRDSKQIEFEILIFDLMKGNDQYLIINEGRINPNFRKSGPYMGAPTMCLLANGALLIYDKNNDEVAIWNTTTKKSIKTWTWSQLKIENLTLLWELEISPLPDPRYLVVEVSINNKLYLVNIENLTLKECIFPKNYTIEAKGQTCFHMLANGQLLSRESKELIHFDLQEMVDFRKETVEKFILFFCILNQPNSSLSSLPFDLKYFLLKEYLDLDKILLLTYHSNEETLLINPEDYSEETLEESSCLTM